MIDVTGVKWFWQKVGFLIMHKSEAETRPILHALFTNCAWFVLEHTPEGEKNSYGILKGTFSTENDYTYEADMPANSHEKDYIVAELLKFLKDGIKDGEIACDGFMENLSVGRPTVAELQAVDKVVVMDDYIELCVGENTLFRFELL